MKRRITTIFVTLFLISASLWAQDSVQSPKTLEIYGFAMVDAGYNFKQIKPSWYDAMRPSRLPSYTDQYGTDGNFYASARQSRFGVKTNFDTKKGAFYAVFDFDMYGVGVDEGQTTIRLRHAYGQFGHWGGGLTESPFMDLDIFPNTFEYWGPNGMGFLRNVQIRWIPILGPSELVFGLEMPGVSADKGEYADRIELQGVKPRLPFPDLSGHYRSAHKWGYVQAGFMLRYIGWEDQAKTDSTDLTGNTIGWGISLSSNIYLGKNTTLRLQVIEGAGVENYFNDAPIDVGIKLDTADKKTPYKGEALGDLGVVVWLDHNWSPKWSSSIGWSMVDIKNSNGQNYDAYSMGNYAAANIIYSPIPSVLMGIELQYVDRTNYKASPVDGFKSTNAFKTNISFKYNFGTKIKY